MGPRLIDGEAVGTVVGILDGEREAPGLGVGLRVGKVEGVLVVGSRVGLKLGSADGAFVIGALVGFNVGPFDGDFVTGACVGLGLFVGFTVGSVFKGVGDEVTSTEGSAVVGCSVGSNDGSETANG